jgi:hypothetical protein
MLIPLKSESWRPEPAVARVVASSSYGFDGGSPAGNGSSSDGVGQIRPGLNVAWTLWDESVGCYLTFDTGDLLPFAAAAISDWRVLPIAIDSWIGGVECDSDPDLEGYEDVYTDINLDPRGQEGIRFLSLLNEGRNPETPIGRRITEFLSATRSD